MPSHTLPIRRCVSRKCVDFLVGWEEVLGLVDFDRFRLEMASESCEMRVADAASTHVLTAEQQADRISPRSGRSSESGLTMCPISGFNCNDLTKHGNLRCDSESRRDSRRADRARAHRILS